MAKTSIQCPDSGLIVAFTYNRINQRVRIYGDEADWEDMKASADSIKATQEWIRQAKAKVEGRRVTVDEIERELGVEVGELTWD